MKRRITLEVDDVALFDRLKRNEELVGALGARVISCLMAGASARDKIALLGVYGIKVSEEK